MERYGARGGVFFLAYDIDGPSTYDFAWRWSIHARPLATFSCLLVSFVFLGGWGAWCRWMGCM